MTISRRSLLTLVILVSAVSPGCNLGWLKVALTLLQVVSPMLPGIVSVALSLAGTFIPTEDVNRIQAVTAAVQRGLQEVAALVQEARAKQDKSSVARAEVILARLVSDLDGLLPSLRITNQASKAKITSSVTAVLAGLRGVLAVISRNTEPSRTPGVLPPVAPPPPQTPSPVITDPEELKRQFNTALTAPSGEPQVDAAFLRAKLI